VKHTVYSKTLCSGKDQLFNKLEKRGKIKKVVRKGCRKEEGEKVSGFQEGSGYRKWKLDEDF
jgi:hypothetical protein